MLKDLTKVSYLPILSVRPAEIIALRELPGSIYDAMLPHILFRPWLGSGTLARAFDKLSHAYPNRPIVLELDAEYDGSNPDVVLEISSLRSPENGFANWVEFCRQHPLVIPCLQVSSQEEQIRHQIAALAELQRGIAVRIPRIPKFGLLATETILKLFSAVGVVDALFVLDFGQTDHRYLVDQFLAINEVNRILAAGPSFCVAVSSTSFPSTFAGIDEQEIFERSFFNCIVKELPAKRGILYSDRGSARLPAPGGGGVPAPRIDLPKDDKWRFFRKDLASNATKVERLLGYQEMAANAVSNPAWDKSLNIWGTQIIKLTQLGSEFGITSPVRSTAARINVHLFRQTALGIQDPSAISMEDDWVD